LSRYTVSHLYLGRIHHLNLEKSQQESEDAQALSLFLLSTSRSRRKPLENCAQDFILSSLPSIRVHRRPRQNCPSGRLHKNHMHFVNPHCCDTIRMSFVIFVCDFSVAGSEKSIPLSAPTLKCQRKTIPGEVSESATPAALRSMAQCIPQHACTLASLPLQTSSDVTTTNAAVKAARCKTRRRCCPLAQ